MSSVSSCCCGQFKLTYEGEIQRTSICHCFACQQRTGSAFGVQTRLEKNKISIQGASTTYKRIGDEGSEMTYHFCPKCGSTLYWEAEWLAENIGVAIGNFCLSDSPTPSREIYENRKHGWVHLDLKKDSN